MRTLTLSDEDLDDLDMDEAQASHTGNTPYARSPSIETPFDGESLFDDPEDDDDDARLFAEIEASDE